MSAFRRCAVAAALAGLMTLAACGTTPASQPGAAKSPSLATSTPAPATTTPAPRVTPTVPQQPVLRLGSRGSVVVTLQQRLAALRYFDVGAADGVFEQSTYHAVIAFQKVQGLGRDGIIDSSTGSGARYYFQGRWARAITPTGRYRIYSRYSGGWQPGPLGSMYRPNYFHGGYALHGMTAVPAYPASHGCVRMTLPAMDRLWSSLRVGMPVAIYSS
jgi:peptidoglycan hydrolase-like protein with peptidoglycan-binding domain